jgi:hypothetical protein
MNKQHFVLSLLGFFGVAFGVRISTGAPIKADEYDIHRLFYFLENRKF